MHASALSADALGVRDSGGGEDSGGGCGAHGRGDHWWESQSAGYRGSSREVPSAPSVATLALARDGSMGRVGLDGRVYFG